jgi:TolB-like protein/Flp pilus assembly protein TadD
MEQAGASAPDVSGYQIDDLIIDLGRQRVTRDGNEVPLPHLSFDLLVTLARAAPNCVSFEQLIKRVWPGLVITPETISQRVKLVRDALGDDPHAPRYIAGIRGRGYRMVATVRPIVEQPQSHAPTAAAHSIAVLPFINLSGDKEQEYFSDGLTEELLNSLCRINELQVAGRTSSFYFKGEHADLATIAHKLNVATVLEGSVRRSEHTVRVSARLTNAETGFHLWSETYDRDLGEVLKLQSEIANAVASALKITLLGDAAAKIELGGTRNPAAFDAYLRAAKTINYFHDERDVRAAIAAYTEAIRLDPNYALAFAGRSLALSLPRYSLVSGYDREKNFAAAHADAQKAVDLAPAMAEGHVALAGFFESTLDFVQAIAEYERALTLGPGNARVLQVSGPFFAYMGRTDAGIAAARRAVVLDPLSPHCHFSLGWALFFSRRYEEALAASGQLVSLDPDSPRGYALRGAAYFLLGSTGRARETCALRPAHWVNQVCLALAEDRLGRHADAETALASLRAKQGDGAAYWYAVIYAQWAKTDEALNWLETALRLRNPGLEFLKTDPLLDPLRKEPRFQAIERELKFPQ